jgi:signal transduction histidine kinase
MIAAISRDITERKEAEQNLLLARERAEFFTDLLSHDINNYIQGVIGFLDLIAQEDLDEDQRKNTTRAMEQANRVSQLIERVRTISKAQNAGELKAMDLGAVVDEAVIDVTQKYSDRPCDVTFEGLEGPTMVMADELLGDLVINLLDNAIKYSRHPEAPVEVSLDRHPTMGGRYVLLSVADRGPGIPDEDKTSIFFRFVRKVEDAEGSGLGLSLVNALTDRYRGRVWVEDRVKGRPGEGARFVVELPVA